MICSFFEKWKCCLSKFLNFHVNFAYIAWQYNPLLKVLTSNAKTLAISTRHYSILDCPTIGEPHLINAINISRLKTYLGSKDLPRLSLIHSWHFTSFNSHICIFKKFILKLFYRTILISRISDFESESDRTLDSHISS